MISSCHPWLSAHLGNNGVLLQLDRCQRLALQQQQANAQVVHIVVRRVQSQEAKELGQQSLPALHTPMRNSPLKSTQ